MIILKWIVMLAVGGYFAFVVFLYLAQRRFVFHPQSAHPSPAAAGGYRRPKKPSSTPPMGRVIIWQVPPRGEKTGGDLFPRQC